MVPLADFGGRTIYYCHISEHGDKVRPYVP